ncbi:MAG TPA: lytic transglycosylase domain-containing protein [Thermoanaerobaculia bacterium]
MRTLLIAAALLVVLDARAEVKLVVRADGSKVIYNTGPSSARGNDLEWLAKQRNRTSVYDEIIERHAKKHGLDPVLVKAVIQVESNYNPRSVSHKGARGLMQLIPGTASRFDVAKVFEPEQNIRGGVAYLAFLRQLFRNDLSRMLAAYNAGENAVVRYGGIPPYEETQLYVRKVLTVYYGRPYGTIQIAGKFEGRKLKGELRSRPAVPMLFVSTLVKRQ